jgi:hypothetical protein
MASATAQVVSLSNPIIAGQSFSVVSGSGFGPLTVANGSMGGAMAAAFRPSGSALHRRSPISKALGFTLSERASTARYFKSL